MLIVIAVAGLWFGQDAARGAIFSQLSSLMGADGAYAIQSLIASVEKNRQSGWGAALGIGLLVLGATTVVAELHSALDVIWRAPQSAPSPGWMQWLRARFLSFGLVLGLGFLLTVSLLLSAALAAWSAWWAPWFTGWDVVLGTVNALMGFSMTVLLFACIYRWMPSVSIAWNDVWIGAGITALLFELGKSVIGLYIGTSGIASGFGAASSLIVVLVWVYYSAQLFLFGAEITWVYANHWGSRASHPPTAITGATSLASSSPHHPAQR